MTKYALTILSIMTLAYSHSYAQVQCRITSATKRLDQDKQLPLKYGELTTRIHDRNTGYEFGELKTQIYDAASEEYAKLTSFLQLSVERVSSKSPYTLKSWIMTKDRSIESISELSISTFPFSGTFKLVQNERNYPATRLSADTIRIHCDEIEERALIGILGE